MQLTRDYSNAQYQITKYEPGCVTVNAQDYRSSILIMSNLLRDWAVQDIAQLRQENFIELLTLQPDVILIGSGVALKFPDDEILNMTRDLNVGVEFMNSAAACRTYAVLVAEGRKVLAGIVI